MPAANATGENIHEHGQIHKVLAQVNVSDIADPDLLGTHNLQVLDEVGIAREGVLAVGRAPFLRRRLPTQSQFAHQALHMLAVDREAFALQWGR